MKSRVQQITLANQLGFEKYARKSRREEFLNVMDAVVPWRELEVLIEPHYAKAGNGRHPVGLSIMLRVYFLQQWFNLSDPGAEDALYESAVLRRFAGVDLGRAAGAQARDAVLKMGEGLPEPAYRSRLQTARCCCV